MVSKEDDLSHEEIWDDSALIDSWNDALAEYKVIDLSRRCPNTTDIIRNITVSKRRVAR
jgi:hypothetical protein